MPVGIVIFSAEAESDIIFASQLPAGNITRRSRISLRSNRTRRKANITEKTPMRKASEFFLERATRLELATSTLARWRSTG